MSKTEVRIAGRFGGVDGRMKKGDGGKAAPVGKPLHAGRRRRSNSKPFHYFGSVKPYFLSRARR